MAFGFGLGQEAQKPAPKLEFHFKLTCTTITLYFIILQWMPRVYDIRLDAREGC